MMLPILVSVIGLLIGLTEEQSIGFSPYYGNGYSNPFTTPMLGYGLGTLPFGYPSYSYPYNYPYAGYGAQYMGGYGFGGYPYGPYGGGYGGTGFGGAYPGPILSRGGAGSYGSSSNKYYGTLGGGAGGGEYAAASEALGLRPG